MKTIVGIAKVGLAPSLVAALAIAVPLVVTGQDRTAAAQAACESALPAAEAYGPIDRVIRAEASDASQVVAWQEGRFADIAQLVSPLRDLPTAAQVTVCLYRGDFVAPAGPPGPDGTSPARNALRLLVLADGSTVLDAFGWEGLMAPETPSDFSGG
jgi:hypothetical protein